MLEGFVKVVNGVQEIGNYKIKADLAQVSANFKISTLCFILALILILISSLLISVDI